MQTAAIVNMNTIKRRRGADISSAFIVYPRPGNRQTNKNTKDLTTFVIKNKSRMSKRRIVASRPNIRVPKSQGHHHRNESCVISNTVTYDIASPTNPDMRTRRSPKRLPEKRWSHFITSGGMQAFALHSSTPVEQLRFIWFQLTNVSVPDGIARLRNPCDIR